MSARPLSPLSETVLGKLRNAFGEPTRIVGMDRHWALRRLSYVSAVNLLLVCGEERPVLWVFDPHDPTNGVHHDTIRGETEIDGLIAQIQGRVRRAGEPLPHL